MQTRKAVYNLPFPPPETLSMCFVDLSFTHTLTVSCFGVSLWLWQCEVAQLEIHLLQMRLGRRDEQMPNRIAAKATIANCCVAECCACACVCGIFTTMGQQSRGVKSLPCVLWLSSCSCRLTRLQIQPSFLVKTKNQQAGGLFSRAANMQNSINQFLWRGQGSSASWGLR